MRTDALVSRLFDEFVEAQVSGERPDVRSYLQRAGSGADQLGVLIDRFLELAPVEAPDEETVVALNARLERVPPLTAARSRLSLKVDDVVERLGKALGLGEGLQRRLREAYQELETEQLDPSGVQERVWEALQAILGLDPRRLPGKRLSHSFAAPVYGRAASRVAFDLAAGSPPPEPGSPREPDEVDVLFRGGLPGGSPP